MGEKTAVDRAPTEVPLGCNRRCRQDFTGSPEQELKRAGKTDPSRFKSPTRLLFTLDLLAGRRRTALDTKPAAGAEAGLLDVSVGAPLLLVERRSLTYADRPVELRRGLYRTEAHYYRNELN